MDACSDACEGEAGTLLADLERRQDEVLAQLDALDQQLTGLLLGLGVTLVDDAETASSAEDAPVPCDEADRQEIKASTWDEPRWERADGGRVAAAAHLAARSRDPRDGDEAGGGFAKLPHQHAPAALREPRILSAEAARGKRAA